jgi:hypothetical protein
LYEKANVIPAFCYTDKGNKIYGAYFYTNPSSTSRVKTFPTGVKRLYRYSDVTSLVKANMGLFLPFSGRRNDLAQEVGMRNMTYDGGAYGQYLTDYSPTAGLSRDFFVGTTLWDLSANSSGQAKAIRPVWDESSTADPNPVYEPFKNIK